MAPGIAPACGDPGQGPIPVPAPIERAPELDVPEFIPAPTGRLQR